TVVWAKFLGATTEPFTGSITQLWPMTSLQQLLPATLVALTPILYIGFSRPIRERLADSLRLGGGGSRLGTIGNGSVSSASSGGCSGGGGGGGGGKKNSLQKLLPVSYCFEDHQSEVGDDGEKQIARGNIV